MIDKPALRFNTPAVMMNRLKAIVVTALSAMTLLNVSCSSGPGGDRGITSKTDARQIESRSRAALDRLYRENPKALELAKTSQGVLVFPEIIKGGFVVGGAGGDGALYQRGAATGYYRSISASWGLQAGLQKYAYALFLRDQASINNLNKSGGWEIGSAPGITVIDKGKLASLSTATLPKGNTAVFFDQKGLMAGLGLQGTKVTRLNIYP